MFSYAMRQLLSLFLLVATLATNGAALAHTHASIRVDAHAPGWLHSDGPHDHGARDTADDRDADDRDCAACHVSCHAIYVPPTHRLSAPDFRIASPLGEANRQHGSDWVEGIDRPNWSALG